MFKFGVCKLTNGVSEAWKRRQETKITKTEPATPPSPQPSATVVQKYISL